MVEMVIAVAVSGIVAASAVIGISTVAAKSRRNVEFDRLLDDIQAQRAVHVAAGRSEPLMLCVDCIDPTGAASPGGADVQVLDVYLADDVADRTHGRPVFSARYDVRLAAECRGVIALDALGRSLDLPPGIAVPVPTLENPLVTKNCDLRLETDAGTVKDAITFGGDGRLLPSFGPPVLPEPPHAQNLSARTTPNPMPRGRFEGDPSRAQALPLH